MSSCEISGHPAGEPDAAAGAGCKPKAESECGATAVSTDSRFSCNICFEEVVEPVVTRCGHLYCWPCLFQWLEPGMRRGERETLGIGLPPSALYGNTRIGDDSRRVCPVCKSECPLSSIIPVYVRAKTPRAGTPYSVFRSTPATKEHAYNPSSSNNSLEEPRPTEGIQTPEETGSQVNGTENDSEIANRGTNAETGLRQRRIQHNPEDDAGHLHRGTVPVPNRPSVRRIPPEQQQQEEPSSPSLSSRISPRESPRATPSNPYRVGGLDIAPRSPNGHNASLTHGILSSFQRAAADYYRISTTSNGSRDGQGPDGTRSIPSLHDLSRNGGGRSGTGGYYYGSEGDGTSPIDVNSETTQYLSRLLIMFTSFVMFCFLLV
ncbi:unnamed protein product [Pseudo-nitzschia multistriata]|uniref:RING-type E3 ubiquitin transferase n=1 Tax=Pseudo-nitzschia multistriata TaxID=183589 RepID=A0A448ZRS7_9STRA|nr:unnamed protein product [Pseudo-nitzschia multistriata]